MSKRLLVLVAVLGLLAAGCAETAADGPATTAEPAVEAVLLSYSLAAGDEFHYEVSIDQHIEMGAEGDAALMGKEDLPGTADVDVSGSGSFTQTVAAGPTDGTFEVHISGDFTDISVTGTVDGESIDSTDAPEFAEIEPIDVTVVVDEQGNLVQESAGEDPMAGMLGGLGLLGEGGAVPGADFGQFIGIPLSDQEVTVGDTWSEEIETPGIGEDPIVTTITSEVTGVNEMGGAEVFVIESQTATSPIEFDMAEFFTGMLGAFVPEGATDEEKAEMEAKLADLRFLISIDDSSSQSTTQFDPEAGLARQFDTTGATNIAMDMNVPDEETQEMVGFVMNLTLDQEVSFRLTSGPTA